MSSLGDQELWGSLLPGAVTAAEGGEIDAAQIIDEALPTLHADSRANLTWWTENELLEWIDDALKRLSRIACVFIGRDTSVTAVAQTATYGLPERHVSTLHISRSTTPLRAANQMELEMQDSAYRTTAATSRAPVSWWYEDLSSNAIFGVAPVPAAAETLPVIYEGYPPAITALQTLISAPAPLKGYLAFYAFARAYRKEGPSEAPDIAAHCETRCQMYEELFARYYGLGL